MKDMQTFDETFGQAMAEAEESVRRGDDQEASLLHGPLVELVDQLILRAVDERATDIHIEPEEAVVRVRFRIDSILQPGPMIPKPLQAAVVARLKMMAGMNLAEVRQPQSGRIRFDSKGRQFLLRVDTCLGVHGEGVVLCRPFVGRAAPVALEELDLPAEGLAAFVRAIGKPRGLVLVTSPGGQGKSATAYAALAKLSTADVSLATVEERAEWPVNFVQHHETGRHADRSGLLRAVLRQDPDFIFVDALDDPETAKLALRAAETGHLVIAGMTAQSALSAVRRLLALADDPLLVSEALVAATCQRLARRTCAKCRTIALAPEDRREELERFASAHGISWVGQVAETQGCPACRFRGTHGRLPLFEIFEAAPEAQELILRNRIGPELDRLARAQGMRTMYEDGLRRVLARELTLKELARFFPLERFIPPAA